MHSPGDFSFMKDIDSQRMLSDAYNAVTLTESWDYIGQDPGNGGFMYSTDIRLKTIGGAMKYDGHSGSSYGWTMRVMQKIANHGWDKFVEDFS